MSRDRLGKRWKISGKHVYEIIIHKSSSQGTQATILFFFLRLVVKVNTKKVLFFCWGLECCTHIFLCIYCPKGPHLTLGNAMEAHH